MDSRELNRSFCRYVIDRHFTLTCNITTIFHFEADIVSLTKSGYLCEYELKVSRSDFRADFKKCASFWNKEKKAGERCSKHDLLLGKVDQYKFTRPNKFSFVVPKGLVSEEEVPLWFGLYEVEGLKVVEVRKPRLLHREKPSEQVKSKIYRNTAYKLVNAL